MHVVHVIHVMYVMPVMLHIVRVILIHVHKCYGHFARHVCCGSIRTLRDEELEELHAQ